MDICVYAASSDAVRDLFKQEAYALGLYFGQESHRLIYGGGAVGLMGAIADGALAGGAEVTGILPNFMIEREWQHPGVVDIRIVKTMHERKESLMLSSEAVVALPGGCGTFEELLEAITWKKLGLYSGEIFIFNSDGYYSSLIDLMSHAVDENFMDETPLFTVVSSLDELKSEIRELSE